MEKARPRHRYPILVVDDDEVFRTRLMRALSDRGWEAVGAPDVPSAVEAARQVKPGRAIVDLRMPGESGLEAIRQLGELNGEELNGGVPIDIIVLTGYGSIASAKQAMRLGAIDYLTKPADADQILVAFDEAETPLTEAADASVPSLARVEWEHIQRVLTDCDHNVSQAARVLGIHRRSLQRKLAKLPPQR